MRRFVLTCALTAALAGGASTAAAAPTPKRSTPQTYGDPVADTTYAPDVGKVTVSNDLAGKIVFEIALANRPQLEDLDRIDLQIDADRSPLTGTGFGWDFALVVEARVGTATYTLRDSHDHVLGAVDHAALPNLIVLSIGRRELARTTGFDFRVVAAARRPGRTGVDVAPDGAARPWRYDLLLDRQAPAIHALAGTGRHGHRARLRYFVSDDSGLTRDVVTVSRNGRRLATIRSVLGPALAGRRYYVSWLVPRRLRGTVTFCVTATDPSGNAAGPSCAHFSVR